MHKDTFPDPGLSTDMQESPGSVGVDGGYANNVPAFLTKLWMLVEAPETNHLICWSSTGTSFHVFDQGRFAKEVLPKYFKHNNMASFVRQLNMYGFRKVVNIEQSGLLKPERDDTEFQHPYFFQDHEHLLEHIKRKVSIVKSEETKIRQEDFSKLLYEVQVLHNQQENMECQIQDIKQQNEVLRQEVASLRQNFTQQQKVMNQLMHFLFSHMQASFPSTVGMKRKVPLMLDDGSTTPLTAKRSQSHTMESVQGVLYSRSDQTFDFSLQQVCMKFRTISPCCARGFSSGAPPSTKDASCSTCNAMPIEPIIPDIIHMSGPGAMAIHMEKTCERCPMIIKEEPVSPAVHRWHEHVSCGVCSEPPVLPLSMVQSVLDCRGSGSVERRDKRTMDRPGISEAVENVDMSFEELLLLLKNTQSSSVSVDELANILVPADMSQCVFHCQEGEVCNTNGCEEQ